METVEDILREMRGIRPDCDDSLSNHTCEYLIRYADRLDAAHKREIKSIVDANEIAMKTAMGEISKLRKTIARLRKTNEVLECARDLWFERADELRRRCEALNNGGVK